MKTTIFSDPGKFYVADPYTFHNFASLMILIFGALALFRSIRSDFQTATGYRMAMTAETSATRI